MAKHTIEILWELEDDLYATHKARLLSDNFVVTCSPSLNLFVNKGDLIRINVGALTVKDFGCIKTDTPLNVEGISQVYAMNTKEGCLLNLTKICLT